FLKQKELPTAIFAVSDILAVGLMNEAQKHAIRVPTDMSVIGFDNIAFSNMFNPRLTTIGQPMYEMGQMAAKMLIDKINAKDVASSILNHELIIRESTREK